MQLQDALQVLLPYCADVRVAGADSAGALSSAREAGFRARDFAARDADAHRWRALSLYEMCSARVRVGYSKANAKHFTALGSTRPVRSATWSRPKVQEPKLHLSVTGLISLRARSIADIRVRARDSDHQVSQLAVPDRSLVVLDTDVAQPDVLLWLHYGAPQRHFIAPAGERKQWRTAQMLDQRTGDCLVEMRVPHALRQKLGLPPYVLWRLIPYHRHGYPPQMLLTSLLDPVEWPRHELSAIHCERWLWNAGSGRPSTGKQAAIEDTQPPAVMDRLWAALCAYNLIRAALAACADDMGEEPVRMDFAAAVGRIGTEGVCAAVADGGIGPLRSALGDGPAAWAELLRSEPQSPVQIAVDPL